MAFWLKFLLNLESFYSSLVILPGPLVGHYAGNTMVVVVCMLCLIRFLPPYLGFISICGSLSLLLCLFVFFHPPLVKLVVILNWGWNCNGFSTENTLHVYIFFGIITTECTNEPVDSVVAAHSILNSFAIPLLFPGTFDSLLSLCLACNERLEHPIRT